MIANMRTDGLTDGDTHTHLSWLMLTLCILSAMMASLVTVSIT